MARKKTTRKKTPAKRAYGASEGLSPEIKPGTKFEGRRPGEKPTKKKVILTKSGRPHKRVGRTSKKPGMKMSRAEANGRVARLGEIMNEDNEKFAAGCLAMGYHKIRIAKEFHVRLGIEISSKQLSVLIKKGRQRLHEATGLTREQLKLESIQRYVHIMTDEDAPYAARVRCMERIDAIWGLESKFDGMSKSPGQIAEELVSLLGSMDEAVEDVDEE